MLDQQLLNKILKFADGTNDQNDVSLLNLLISQKGVLRLVVAGGVAPWPWFGARLTALPGPPSGQQLPPACRRTSWRGLQQNFQIHAYIRKFYKFAQCLTWFPDVNHLSEDKPLPLRDGGIGVDRLERVMVVDYLVPVLFAVHVQHKDCMATGAHMIVVEPRIVVHD